MKFTYFAAALLPLAFASPVALEAPEDHGLTFLDARTAAAFQEGLDLFEKDLLEERDDIDILERDDDMDILERDDDVLEAFDELFAELDERTEDFEDEAEEEMSEIEARSAGQIIGSLKSIVKAIGGVNKQLGKFGNKQKPSTAQALAVRKAAGKLQSAVNRAIGVAKKNGKQSTGASKKIFGYVSKKLKPAALKSLAKFRAHAPGFKSGGFGGLVKTNLKKLAKSTVKEGKALLGDTKSKSIKKKGAKVLKQIKSAFIKTIKKY